MKPKFLQLLDDLVNHVYQNLWHLGLYIGNMHFSLEGTKSARKVTSIGLIKSHFD
jgi:hypothetical protein